MERNSSILSVCLLLLLGGVVACGGQDEHAEALAALEAEYTALEGARGALEAQRAELARARSEAAETAEEAAATEEEAEADAAAAEARQAELQGLESTVGTAAEEFGNQLVRFINSAIDLEADTEGSEGEARNRALELKAAGIRMKSDEDVLVAREYIEKGGDYRRAIEIYNTALRFDPDYGRLKDELAAAEASRYMTEERFAQVEKGMTRAEVTAALGPVNQNLVQDYPERNVIAWFYPKGEEAGAAGVYFEKKKDGTYRVYRSDFNAAKGKEGEEEEGG